MTSKEYKILIRFITKNVIRKQFPGVNKKAVENAATIIAKNVHARFYGANVDGVDSPIWRDDGNEYWPDGFKQPTIDANQLLVEE